MTDTSAPSTTIPPITLRWLLMAVGAIAGMVFWGLAEAIDGDSLSKRQLLVLMMGTSGFFATLMIMLGPVKPPRALTSAAIVAVLAGGLTLLVSLRYADAEDIFNQPMHFLALSCISALPVPFLIAAGGAGWRHYPSLFSESWSIVVRGTSAWVFVGVIWAVIWLSDALLNIVGLTFIGDLVEKEMVPFVLTGAGLGLGLAVVTEHADLISPRLVLRLLRLFAPVILAVTVIFLVAAPLRGLSNLFNHFSAALVLLTMAAAAVTLVTISVDRDDSEAAANPVLRQSARGLALTVVALAALAAWAIWLRVGQYGWTPERMFAALVAVLGLAYGLAYAAAVLRPGNWLARVRGANLAMALTTLAVAVLWLTPVLNAERISARAQLARLEAGTMPVTDVQPWVLRSWGTAGEEALAVLTEKAKSDPALAAALASDEYGTPVLPEADLQTLRDEVVAVLPLQPASATGTRDSFLMLMQEYEVQEILSACRVKMAGDRPGCVMVVADLVPQLPGEEVALGLDREGWVSLEGLYLRDGTVMRRQMLTVEGQSLTMDLARLRMAEWQDAPPPLTRVDLNQVGTGADGIFIAP